MLYPSPRDTIATQVGILGTTMEIRGGTSKVFFHQLLIRRWELTLKEVSMRDIKGSSERQMGLWERRVITSVRMWTRWKFQGCSPQTKAMSA